MTVRVDAHVHLYDEGFWPSKWFDFVAEKWAHGHDDRESSQIRSRIEPGMADGDGSRLIEQMDANGIDLAVILNVDWEIGMGGPALVGVDEVHGRYQTLAKHYDGRMAYFAGVDPRRPEAVELLIKAHEQHGACGLKLYPPVGFYPYDEIVGPLLEVCVERQLPVAVHTGGTLGLLRPRFGNPLFIQDVQRSFPGLTIWIAHSGASWWWEEAVAVAKNGRDTYMELSGWQSLAYEDEREFVTRLGRAVGVVGAGKLLFGSDHISGEKVRGAESYRRWVEWFSDLVSIGRKYGVHFTPDDVDAIMGGNAARCLGVKS